MSSVRVYVNLDDIYDEMDHYDKQKIAEWLHDDGVLEDHPNRNIRKVVKDTEELFGEVQLRNGLNKLWNGYYQLSNEDIELIKTIANKL